LLALKRRCWHREPVGSSSRIAASMTPAGLADGVSVVMK